MRSARLLTLPALMTAVMCLLSPISIPVGVTAVTLQTFVCALAGYLVGARGGFFSVCAYLLLGLCGLPVFSGFAGGAGVFAGPTGGFLAGFPLMALLCGAGSGQSLPRAMLTGLSGLAVVYLTGAFWMKIATGMTVPQAFWTGVVPFIGKDVLSLWAAAWAARAIRRRMRRG